MPARALTSDAVVHDRIGAPAPRIRHAPAPGAPTAEAGRLPERGMDPGAVLLALLGSANLSSRRPVFEQYDSTVQANTVAGPGHGAAVLRVKGTPKALVATTDGNQAVGLIDPWLGAALSVAEATRNVAITGARPLGVTNCLNFGDPTRPEAFWQLSEAVRGLGDACRALGLPVTGGNVSLYNESPAGAIAPTPEIGVVGLLEDIDRLVGPGVQRRRGCRDPRRRGDPRSRGQRVRRPWRASPPRTALRHSTSAPRRHSRHSSGRPPSAACSRRPRTWPAVAWPWRLRRARCGAIPIAGSAPASGSAWRTRPPSTCSARAPSRVVASTRPRYAPALLLLARQHGLDAEELGVVEGERLVIELAGAGATGAAEERGSRVADALDVARRRPSPRLGERACREPSAGTGTEMCGVFGAVMPPSSGAEAAAVAALGLFALQHRGQESAGVAVSDGEQLMLYKDLGMISSVLDERRIPSLRGELAIAHCRYSTTGSTVWENAQPTFRLGPRRAIAIGHNGNLVNTRELLASLIGGRGRLPASTDTELLTALLADEPAADTVDALVRVLPRVRGAYSLVVLDERRVIGVRDPFGFRPLVLGRLPADGGDASNVPDGGLWGDEDGDAPAGACRPRRPGSTSSAPSTSATSSPARSSSSRPAERPGPSASPRPARRCASSSSSTSPGPIRTWRAATCTRSAAGWGCSWPREHPADADLVMPVPDTGAPAAAGYAEASGIPYREGLVRNRYSGPDVHPAVADDAPAGRDDQAQPAARGRPRQAPDGRRRLDRPRHDDQADRRRSSAGPAPRRSTSGSARRRSTTRASTASTPRSRRS